MSRRRGQNPKVRIGRRADGSKFYLFQYWIDVPGQEERKRMTEVIGPINQMTKSEAERKKLEFISKLTINSSVYQIPSSENFARAIKHYREKFAPQMLRASTFSIADTHLRCHLEADWKDVPIEHITIDAVNEWAWKKRQAGLEWVTIKNILRTMQRVLSSYTNKPCFSQKGLRIPEQDKLRMKIKNHEAVSFSWHDALRIAAQIRKLNIAPARGEQFATLMILAAATGLRCSELFALKVDDIDFTKPRPSE